MLVFDVPWRCPIRLEGNGLFTNLIRHSSYVNPPEQFLVGLHRDALATAKNDPLQLVEDHLKFSTSRGEKTLQVDMRNTQFIAADRSIGVYPDGYELDVMAAIDLLVGEKDGFIDAGANWGYFSLYLALRTGYRGKIIAFEPAAGPREDFQKLIKGLGLEKQLELSDLALSDINGKGLISQPTWSGEAAITGEATGERIKLKQLDSLNLPPVQLIKIDVEGSEAALMRGAWNYINRNKPHIVFECRTDAGPGWSEAIGRMEGHGYSCFAMQAEAITTNQNRHIRLELTPVSFANRSEFPLHLNVLAVHDVSKIGQDLTLKQKVTQSEKLSVRLLKNQATKELAK